MGSHAKRIAVVGAGAAGLAAAWRLRHTGLDITVIEKSRGLSGRAASRTRHGVRFDHGANYFKAEPAAVEELVLRQLPTADLVRVEGDIWTFDRSGTLAPGDPDLNAEPKWNYRTGISTLGKLLAAECGARVRQESRVARLSLGDRVWTVHDSDGAALGNFDAVLLTPPAPQIAELLEHSALDTAWAPALSDALRGTEYFQQFCFVLAFDGERTRPGDFHALLNSDRAHPISWLSFENDKPGHVPPGLTVAIVQMQPEWSQIHFERDPGDLLPEVLAETSRLLRWPPTTPAWTDRQRWRFAHPRRPLASETARNGEADGLFIAGDALAGKGRVNLAIASGLEAAGRIEAALAGA